jgi:protein O-GlcNAc transferase
MRVSDDDLLKQATMAMQTGDNAAAENFFKKILRQQPRHVAALNLFSIFLARCGRHAEAERFMRRALAENAASDASFFNYGLILKALNRPAEALEQFNRALNINNRVAETWNARGSVFNNLDRHEEALDDFDRALALKPNSSDALINKGNVLMKLKRHGEALDAYARALVLSPNSPEALLGNGNALKELKKYEEAFAAFEKVLISKPNVAGAWLGCGNIHAIRQRLDEALDAYDRAMQLEPNLAEIWLGRGNIFTILKRYDEAFAAYDKALAIAPDLAAVWLGRGNIFNNLKRYDETLAAFDKALALDPNLDYVEGARLNAKLMLCAWDDLAAEVAHLAARVQQGSPACPPFVFLAVSSSPADQLQCAKNYVAAQPSFPPLWHGERYAHERIRVAYLSADFREHPVAHLIAGLFEAHDRARFECFALSFGPDDGSEMCRRIATAFEHFIDCRAQSDDDLAALMRRHEIDIAVDLMGFTLDNRSAVLARRPAPVQVNYLGFAGTMGADYMDYIMADAVTVPRQDFAHYSERVVWLPDSFQINDRRRAIAEPLPRRLDCGLPESGFVFCCFNNTFKIAPQMFEVWMRLLNAAEGSVLWLAAGNDTAVANLRREAERRGVDPGRLVFAPRTPRLADHLSRHRLADLFLDTLPYNAHVTASDALWTGVPLLTCRGETYAGRVGTSLLQAAGLPELVASSLTDYEALALKLAREPATLGALKDRLARNRMRCPLFDTERSTRHIEAAYATMYERQQRGEPPQNFAVAPSH